MQKSVAPDKPFLAYYTPGTAHAPHHAPEEWIAKFNGQFDQGWDKVREETFARSATKVGTVTDVSNSLDPLSSLRSQRASGKCRPKEREHGTMKKVCFAILALTLLFSLPQVQAGAPEEDATPTQAEGNGNGMGGDMMKEKKEKMKEMKEEMKEKMKEKQESMGQ